MKGDAFVLYCVVLFVKTSAFVFDINAIEGGIEDEFVDPLERRNLLNGRADVVFLLDRSGSVGATNFEIMKGFVESLLTHVAVDANATRVAVISYSNYPTLHVNYIKDPKTKCFLSMEMQDVIYQDSQATNIAAALEEARSVLLNSRANVSKVVVLISDGMATLGEDPIPVANRLKSDTGAQIYAFGIGRFLKTQLLAMATSPKHFYNCAGFKEFKKLARKIRGDPHGHSWSDDSGKPNCDHLCDSPYKGQDKDPGCCDFHAKCSCALLSGLHTCVCEPGYFGLSGTLGKCHPCPRGSYKSKLENTQPCSPCPLGSTTSNIASTSLSDCHCKDGYVGNPLSNIQCSRVSCPPLQNPTNGFIIGDCETVYESECYFSCADNFELVNPRADVRVCEANGQWSEEMPSCHRIRCSVPDAPNNGRVVCDLDLFVGEKCHYQCEQGYQLQGSKKRICQANKHLSGEDVYCMAVQCPAPNSLPHGTIYVCRSDQPLIFGDTCAFRCNEGYELIGSPVLYCGPNATYVNDRNEVSLMPYCRDITIPEIFCPPSQVLRTLRGYNFALTIIPMPRTMDNSGEEVRVKPVYKIPDRFFIGRYVIRYKAIDTSNLVSYCEFSITVKDDERPQVLSCPSTITVNTTEEGMKVSWVEPIFRDNSNGKLDIQQSNHPNDFFVAGSHFVDYIAYDSSHNAANCRFQVIVNQNYCPYYHPPINGAFTCEDWMYGQFCQAYCNERFDFITKPAEWYICNSDAEWETDPEGMAVPWPDCARRILPNKIRQMLNGFYYSGNCNDFYVQDAIKRSFIRHFTQKFDKRRFCLAEGACTPDMVKVTCGSVDPHFLHRYKREAEIRNQSNILHIEVDIPIFKDDWLQTPGDIFEEFLNSLDGFEWNVDEELLQELEDLNMVLSNDKPVHITSKETIIICEPGSVLKDHECAMCSLGYYHDIAEDKCMCCPSGSYQDEEGQTDCLKCPLSFDTENSCSKNATECREICHEGTYSPTGIETCISCSLGSYQNESRQTECIQCSQNTTTFIQGSISIEECHGYVPCINDIKCKNGGSCVSIGEKSFCLCDDNFIGCYCECEKNDLECFLQPCSNEHDLFSNPALNFYNYGFSIQNFSRSVS